MNVYIFAHQDDEFFCLPQLRKDAEEKKEVKLIYLTNGEFNNVCSSVRNLETLSTLFDLGIEANAVSFLGSILGISDGSLHRSASFVSRILAEIFTSIEIDNIYIPCYEGGHQDHDSISFIINMLALPTETKVYQFPLYNGYGVPFSFFRVMKNINGQVVSDKSIRFKISDMKYIFNYRSQFKTFLGLAPFIMLRLLFNRTVTLVSYDSAYLKDRPHEGRLLYESRLGLSFRDVVDAIECKCNGVRE